MADARGRGDRTFATMLRVELARQRITQDEFAARIGSTQAAVSHWTRGLREPSVSKAAQSARALNVSLDYLCDPIAAAEDGR